MILHDDPDDLDFRMAMKLQMRQISEEQFDGLKGMPQKYFLHLAWI